jgi:serine/threonine protein kinase
VHGRLLVTDAYCPRPNCGKRAHLDAGTVMYGGKYHIVRNVAEGGMATIYQATDSQGGIVAVKEVRVVPDPQDPQKVTNAHQKFEQEGLMLRCISSPHIPACFDNWDEFGTKFMALEFIDGRDFEQIAQAQGGTMTDDEDVLKFAIAVCEGLEVLHSIPIVHRDIKPANIMQDKTGKIIVMDLGISKAFVLAAGTGTLIGTPQYAALEQMTGHAEPRSDLYSVAMSMMRLKLGPQILTLDHDQRLDEVDKLPIEWQGIMRRAIGVFPDDRQADITEFKNDLQSLLAAPPITQNLKPRPISAQPAAAQQLQPAPPGPVTLTFDNTAAAFHGSREWRQPVTGVVREGNNPLRNAQVVPYLLDFGSQLVYTGAKQRTITTDNLGRFALRSALITAPLSVTRRQVTLVVLDPTNPVMEAARETYDLTRPAGQPGNFLQRHIPGLGVATPPPTAQPIIPVQPVVQQQGQQAQSQPVHKDNQKIKRTLWIVLCVCLVLACIAASSRSMTWFSLALIMCTLVLSLMSVLKQPGFFNRLFTMLSAIAGIAWIAFNYL